MRARGRFRTWSMCGGTRCPGEMEESLFYSLLMIAARKSCSPSTKSSASNVFR